MKAHVILMLIVSLAINKSFAQTSFDGNSLAFYIGKSATGAEMKDLKANYHCEMVNETHYLSKDGSLNEINLYNKSAVYGSFTGKLPGNLKFGMASADVKHFLGKPVASYNNGYCEFDISTCIISCWFESGALNQVGIAQK